MFVGLELFQEQGDLHGDYESASSLFASFVERDNTIGVVSPERCEDKIRRLLKDFRGLGCYIRLREISFWTIRCNPCSLGHQSYWTRLGGGRDEILSHRAHRAMEPEVSSVSDRTFGGVKYETIRAWNRVVHVNRFHFNAANLELVAGSKCPNVVFVEG